MQSAKKITGDMQINLEMKDLIEVYEEIAATRMRSIRQKILECREFYEQLNKLSDEVGSDLQSLNTLKQHKTAAVFVSANAGLFGDIIEETLKIFLEYVKKNPADIFIIGRLGGELMRQFAPQLKFKSLPMGDDRVGEENMNYIISELVSYSKIIVFYGKFKNIAVQLPMTGQVSGESLPRSDYEIQMLKKKRMAYLYEPSLFSVSQVFANEIMSSTVGQMIRESQLAKFASRLMRLDSAMEQLDENLENLTSQKRRVKKKLADKKLNSSVAGIWAATGGNL